MPGLRKTSRRSNKDNKNKTRVRKQKKRRTQRQNKRQKRTLKGGSAKMKEGLTNLKNQLENEKLMANESTQHLREYLRTLHLNETEIDTVLESIEKLSTLGLNKVQQGVALKSIRRILKNNDSVSDKINAVQKIIINAQNMLVQKDL